MHDDGSQPGMYDLEIRASGRVTGAAEVTFAADPAAVELWRLVNPGPRLQIPEIAGGWLISLRPEARGRQVLQAIPSFLAQLEGDGIRSVSRTQRGAGSLERTVRDLGIRRMSQNDTNYPGSVYFTIERGHEMRGGFVSDTGDPLSRWLEGWIRRPEQKDNLEKLGRSGAPERHLFVIQPGFTSAPFVAADILMRSPAPLPTKAPDLPPEVTHLWTMSTWDSGEGLRWSAATGWERFAKAT
ncbi:MAG: hypothetical protein WD770_02470 [Actinomycetota bacterium]